MQCSCLHGQYLIVALHFPKKQIRMINKTQNFETSKNDTMIEQGLDCFKA